MDSLTQIALGAAVSEAVMQNKVGRKASLWGAICGTLPDLDVLIPMGNAVKDFTYHRAESHAFFYMALAAPLFVWLITKIHPSTKEHKVRWLLAVFLTFITHALLDSFTVYGTQLLLPFSNFPVGWNTIFVIDPLYTIPLLLGLASLFFIKRNPKRSLKLNIAGLIVSSLYLVWSVGVKAHVSSIAENSLINQNITASKILAGPSPFNTVLWRVIGITDSGYVEGSYSLFDESDEIKFIFHSSENEFLKPIADDWNVKRLQWFTKGFYRVSNIDNKIVITDLRMGVGSLYFFRFAVGEINNKIISTSQVEKLDPEEIDSLEPLVKLWQRIWDEDVEIY
ncbi:MAG: metal-dependent hydrolase [Ignavibacteriae bacterium]|nr:metal-dependent hydrolase [Ignavibacteriota bacterium]NOG99581.1 metal-dependent hydrolase [Ignavibacteriota bacterium]